MYPVSAILAKDEVMNVFQPGDHGSTFGGNPLGSALAREALKIIADDKLPQRAFELGIYFRDKLNSINSPVYQRSQG